MGGHFERQFGNITLRTCHTVGEFRQVFQLQKEVWGFEDVDLVPVRMFVVGEKIGGDVIGAFDGHSMVGFSFGIPGVRGGHSYLHSHMLAVAEGYRNTGLGRALKLFQREWAIENGFDLMEWTFDPLEIKNAYLNLVKLGAIARRYLVNHYGLTSSPLQGGLPTDRLVAEWWLKSKRVEAAVSAGESPQAQPITTVEVPGQIYSWKADESKRAQAAQVQSRNRDALQKAFGQGLTALGYERDEQGNGRFLLGYWDEDFSYQNSK